MTSVCCVSESHQLYRSKSGYSHALYTRSGGSRLDRTDKTMWGCRIRIGWRRSCRRASSTHVRSNALEINGRLLCVPVFTRVPSKSIERSVASGDYAVPLFNGPQTVRLNTGLAITQARRLHQKVAAAKQKQHKHTTVWGVIPLLNCAWFIVNSSQEFVKNLRLVC